MDHGLPRFSNHRGRVSGALGIASALITSESGSHIEASEIAECAKCRNQIARILGVPSPFINAAYVKLPGRIGSLAAQSVDDEPEPEAMLGFGESQYGAPRDYTPVGPDAVMSAPQESPFFASKKWCSLEHRQRVQTEPCFSLSITLAKVTHFYLLLD